MHAEYFTVYLQLALCAEKVCEWEFLGLSEGTSKPGYPQLIHQKVHLLTVVIAEVLNIPSINYTVLYVCKCVCEES